MLLLNNSEKFEKAIELEQFVKNYVPKGWRESIKTCTFAPSITEDNYVAIEKAYNEGNLEKTLKNYCDKSMTDSKFYRFREWYIIEAIQKYFGSKIAKGG